jgi:Zn-dependent protease with chaperone function
MSSYRGFYTDGRSGHRREITARLDAEGLGIVDGDGVSVAEWPYGALVLVEEVYPGQPVRLKQGRRGVARLTFDDHTILDGLTGKAARLKRRDYRRHNTTRRAVGWTAGLVGVVFLFIFGLPLAAEPIAALVPLKWEEALGRSVRNQAVKLLAGEARMCSNSKGRAALNRLVTRLAGTVKTRYRFRVVVINHPLVNAFAAPGGYIIVFRGLINKTPTPEGFAGVLAHEMGHVIERHGTEAIIKAIGLGVIVSAIVGDSSSIGNAAADFASDLVTKSYSRSAEREADRIGVTMLNRANIRGDGFAHFFKWVAKKEGRRTGLSPYFAAHPASAERAREVMRMATGRGPAMSAADWRAIKSICR